VAPDPHRIAVLPFRVTTADSLLGEGLAELVAAEFAGEGNLRAVNMGTVLRGWRAAGGGPRSPLTQERAARLARDLRAGFYVDGSVVGLGHRLTINASMVGVPGGEARRVDPVTGPADSLDVLVGRLISSLLATGGTERAAARARLTDSPQAMRAFLEGLSQFRRGRIEPAATAFERAFAGDSLFARAAFMRWQAGFWFDGGTGWTPIVWRLRDRLSAADRVLLVGQLGSNYPASRSLAERLSDRQRAADQLPESAEAQYFLGDFLYHYGSLLDVPDVLARARASFERSVALDSQATVFQHLLEMALTTGDTALARRAYGPYDRVAGPAWDWGMAVAALLGDQAMLAAERRRAASPGDRSSVPYILADAVIPTAAANEIFDSLSRFVHGDELDEFVVLHLTFAVVRGQPAASLRVASQASAAAQPWTDRLLAIAALSGDGDSAAAAAALQRLRALSTRDTTASGAQSACLVAFADLRSPGSADEWSDALIDRRGGHVCAAMLTAVRAVREHAADAGMRLHVADSVLRYDRVVSQTGFEQLALARAWEAWGDLPRALSMTRARPYGVGSVIVEATRCREEGRLAALAGDTTGAIAAYRRYLALRQDAEAGLIPQRDSVRAELGRLTRP
jgi:tetratricopeptide (TPR) repeat protein/TolB-like protein